jgi:hypothetical protein
MSTPDITSGHPDHIRAFADPDAAERWFNANDPEGVAFEYEIIIIPRNTGIDNDGFAETEPPIIPVIARSAAP